MIMTDKMPFFKGQDQKMSHVRYIHSLFYLKAVVNQLRTTRGVCEKRRENS